MRKTDESRKMLITTAIRLYVLTFLCFFVGRYTFNNFLQEVPDSFISSKGHLINFDFVQFKNSLHLIFYAWLSFGFLVLFFTKNYLFRFVFFILSYIYVGYLNSIILPLRSEYYPIIFLLLILLLDSESENKKENQSIIFFGKLFWVLIYFGAGLSKVYQNNFLSWFEPRSIQSFVFYQYQFFNLDFNYLHLIYKSFFFQYLSMPLAILFELTYPLIYIKKITKIYLLLTILFHIAVVIVLQTFFIAHLGGIVFWLIKLKAEIKMKN